jgi:hypothetical protein
MLLRICNPQVEECQQITNPLEQIEVGMCRSLSKGRRAEEQNVEILELLNQFFHLNTILKFEPCV